MKKLTESILTNLNESTDVSSFDVSSTSPFMKVICDVAGISQEEVKECIGYVFNDFEPEDFILEMNDGTGRLVNINRGKVESFNSKQGAMKKLFGDGGNYIF